MMPLTNPGRFLPIGPLLRFGENRSDLARRIGRPLRTVEGWRRTGRIPVLTADDVACALGMHPYEVWGEAWLEVDDTYAGAA